MKPHHRRTLVLNADYTPISIIRWTTAIKNEHKGTMVLVDFYENDYIRGTHGKRYPIPAVMALKKYVAPKKKAAFSRKNVFIRDQMKCQYCGERFPEDELTVDHVVPRSKFVGPSTPTCWTNIVASCQPCNSKKADRMLHEIPEMKLLKKPVRPNLQGFILGLAPWTPVPKEWEVYLSHIYKDLVVIHD